MPAASCQARRVEIGLALLCLGLCEASASAGDARLTINFLSPFGASRSAPPFTFELVEAAHARRVPRFTLVGAERGPQITQYVSELPRLTIGKLSFAPSYGDQRLALELPAASLAGMGVEPRPLRGLSLTARTGTASLSIAAGQLGAREPGLLGSAIPRVVSVMSTIKAHRRVSVAPRAIVPIGRADRLGAATTGLGTGGRVDVAPHLAAVGDVGAVRLASSTWAHSAAGGLVGGWPRAAFELSVARADRNYTLLGPVGFAGLDRETVTSRVTLRAGQTLSGYFGRARPHGRDQQASGSTIGSLVWQAEHVSGGTLTAGYDRNADRSRQVHHFRMEWHGAPAGWASTIRLVVRRHQSVGAGPEPPAFRELFVQVQQPAWLAKWIAIDGRATVALSGRPAGTPHMNWRITSRLAAITRLTMDADTEGALFGVRLPGQRLSSARVAMEVAVGRRTSVRVSYGQAPGAPTRFMQRLEGRIIRTLAF